MGGLLLPSGRGELKESDLRGEVISVRSLVEEGRK